VIALIGYKIVGKKVNDTVLFLVDNLFKDRTVKSAMSILGKKSGAARTEQAVVDDAAEQFLSGPQMGGIKFAMDAIGIDLESMVEKHGAAGTMSGLLQLAGLLGIDIQKLITDGASGGLAGIMGGSSPQTGNPYLKT